MTPGTKVAGTAGADCPIVDCPNCGARVQWNDNFPHRPFCSLRCKDTDFIDWAAENRRIAGSNSYDDLFSENMPDPEQ